MGVSMTTVRALRQTGHDVLHLREVGLSRLADADVMQKARDEERIVLTFDLDFGDLLALGGDRAPSVVLCRLANESPSSVTPKVQRVLEDCRADLEAGAIVIVEDTRYRLRRLPLAT
jgi:predicted nuclease of predicted toxin-antitoxin system